MGKQLERLGSYFRELDEKLVNFIRLRTNLIVALVVLGLCLGGAVTNHAGFVVGILVIGGISYFFGIVVALLVAVAFVIVGLTSLSSPGFSPTEEVLEIVCYLLISWLGYSHRQQTKLQAEQQHQQQVQQVLAPSHSAQTIPWSVSNEVRTSLAAVRFLLFPLNRDEESDRTIQRASAELSRLEHMFNEMERENMEMREQRHVH